MGRHADPDPRHFWLSFGTAAVRALLALALVVGLFAVLANVGGPPEDGPAMVGLPDTAADTLASPHPVPAGQGPDRLGAVGAEPIEELGEPPSPEPEPDPPGTQTDALLAEGPPPEETTVQVLDGVGASPHLPLLVSLVEELGYRVVAVNPARVDYATTTVLYSPGREHAARALQARHPRVGEIRESPGLSETVDLHIVLGADWQP